MLTKALAGGGDAAEAMGEQGEVNELGAQPDAGIEPAAGKPVRSHQICAASPVAVRSRNQS